MSMLCGSSLLICPRYPLLSSTAGGGGRRLNTGIPLNSRRFSLRMSTNQLPQQPPPLLKTITKLLWGPSLPPGLLISTVRTAWSSAWQLMMAQLAPADPSGGYTRPTSQFRLTGMDANSISGLNPKASSFHLYVGLPCPWAHRALIVRELKGLEDAVPVSIAAPGQDGLWVFSDRNQGGDALDPVKDKANGSGTLKEVYKLRKGGYSGRATVPMLWDVERKEVVCNESYDIIEFFNSGLNGLARNPGLDLAPQSLKGKIEEWNQVIYPNINNGVYRCGFAQSQEAYDIAVNDLFRTLDKVDDHLANSRYLCGDTLTLADVCLFTTLIRFDIVYNGLFKCSKKKVIEYPNLHGYMRDIYQIPRVAETCDFGATMDGYYKMLFPLNPGGIRPVTPSACEQEALWTPHNRERMSQIDKKLQTYVT